MEHLAASRGWELIRDQKKLTSAERQHLGECSKCNDWFTTFAQNARSAGFVIAFSIPPLNQQKNRAKGA
jgi:predicted anti-sigma-YlaC factor YlaD